MFGFGKLSRWAEVWLRVRAALRRRSVEREIDGELAYHMEMRARDLEATGVAPHVARREAKSLFGDYGRIRSECRELMMVDEGRQGDSVMSDFMYDVRYTLRSWFRNPGFATTVILTLALGIGANSAIFSVVDGVLLRPLPYDDSDRLVMVWQNDRLRGTQLEWFSGPDYFDLLERHEVFGAAAAWEVRRGTLTGPDNEPQQITVVATSHQLFPMLGATPLLGRVFDAQDDVVGGSPMIVLSHQLWTTRFGSDESIIGRHLTIEGVSLEVIGVMPRDFAYPTNTIRAWAPLQIGPTSRPRGNHNFRIIARLADGVSVEQAQANVTSIATALEAEYPDDNQGRGMWVQTLMAATVGSVRPALIVLLAAVGFVLLIACVNVANLFLARATVREREVALRTALGADRRRLLRQFLTESVTVGIGGGVVGLLFAFGGVRALIALGPATLPRLANVTIDARVLSFAMLVSVGTGLLFGLIPALQASNPDLQAPLKEGTRTLVAGGKHRARRFLVVTEVALAVMLVTGAGLLMRTFWQLQQVDPGFTETNVLLANVQLPAARYPQAFGRSDFAEVMDFHRQVKDGIARLPGVEAVALAVHHPLNPGWTSRFTVDGRPPVTAGEQEEARINPVSHEYFNTVGIPIVRGRSFNELDRADAPDVVIINETFARRHFPDEDPVGQRISFWGVSREIVGVAADVKFRGLSNDTRQGWYAPIRQIVFAGFTLVIRTTNEPQTVLPLVQQVVNTIDADLPLFGVSTMRDRLSASVAQPRFNMLLLGLFAGIAIALATVGIYGVMSYSVGQRIHEIGVRISLGANAADVMKQIVGQGLALAGIGVVVGIGASLLLTRAMSSLLFGVGSTDFATFMAVPLVVGVAAVAATYLPARRASRVDPMVSLRSE